MQGEPAQVTQQDADAHQQLTAVIERLVRQELATHLEGDRLPGMGQPSGAALELLQWLGPWIASLIFDAVRTGMSLHALAAAAPVPGVPHVADVRLHSDADA